MRLSAMRGSLKRVSSMRRWWHIDSASGAGWQPARDCQSRLCKLVASPAAALESNRISTLKPPSRPASAPYCSVAPHLESDFIFLQLVPERVAADPQKPRRLRLIIARLLEGFHDQHALMFLESVETALARRSDKGVVDRGGRTMRRRPFDVVGQVRDIDQLTIGHHAGVT